MEFNIHPLIVHFPIGLLVIYSLLELASLSRWGRSENLQFTKMLLLVFGVLGARAALQTGEIAQDIANFDGQLHDIVELHEWFANASTNIFFGLAIAYLILYFGHRISHPIVQKLVWFVQKLQSRKFFVIAAIAGVICLMVTWALGGSLVYGVEADPITQLLVPWLLQW